MIEPGTKIAIVGPSGAGKSTIAEALAIKLNELQHKQITILDGDEVRKLLSSELGFSKEHRSLNIRRIGFVAHHIARSGGIVLCCPIAPYYSDRQVNRKLISSATPYIEVFVATSLDECEKRDTKGLYAKARAGLVKEFTGISDPYEAPQNAEIMIDTKGKSISECVDMIVNYLKKEGLLG